MYNFQHLRDGRVSLNRFVPSDREIILMIRGLSRSSHSWLGLDEALSRHFDVICLDLPGIGLSKNEAPLYRVQDMALKILEVIRALRLPRVYLVGMNLGAMVVLETAHLLPLELIRGLVLMAPSHSGIGWRRLTRETLKVFRQSLKADPETLMQLNRDLQIGKLEDGRELSEADPDRLHAWEDTILKDIRELGPKERYAQMTAALSYTSRQALNHVRAYQIPFKFILSSDDRMIPIEHARSVYDALKHPQSAIIELQKAGHDPLPTHADQLEDIILQFVREQSTYRVYPVQMLPQHVSARRQLQNRVYTSVGLFSLSVLIFSWMLRGKK